MDNTLRREIEANLFPIARQAVEPWNEFPWHSDGYGRIDTWKPHASQALTIDVFGTLKMAEPRLRDSIIDAWCEDLKIPPGGPWQVLLEWRDESNLLREIRRPNIGIDARTQVDVLVRGRNSLVFIEVKFSEFPSACSQPTSGQCNGNYEIQTNSLRSRAHRCTLAAKGIRYWDIIPRTFSIEGSVDHKPCPFAGFNYQWMRNLVLCRAIAEMSELHPAFAIAYVDHPLLPMAQYLDSDAWREFRALNPQPEPRLLDLRRLAEDIASAGDDFAGLDAWVESKIGRYLEESIDLRQLRPRG
jgi:hypothetical protein